MASTVEIVEHWEHGSQLIKKDGLYRVVRGLLTDQQYIRQLESRVISKHIALKLATEDRA